MTKTFAAQMADFRDRTNGRMRTVLSSSVQDVVEEAQRPVSSGGRMPVDTGFLRNSLVSELNGTEVAQGGYGYLLVVTQVEPGDTARFGYAASYAMRVENGFVGTDKLGREYNQHGRHFVEGAASQWPDIVQKNVDRLK